MPQVLEPQPKSATVAETIAPSLDLDLTFDDLTDLQHSIADLFRAKDRGDDITQQFASVQQSIKALAIEFGIIPEIYAQQDEMLKRSGMKTTIVPIAS